MTTTTASPTRRDVLPWSALLALGTAVFITSLTETLPAGVLPQMSSALGVSSGAAGQTVTVYAIGTALTAIPLTAATAGVRRKPLLLGAMAVFLVANTLTAAAPGYAVLLLSRFLAGVAAGLAWALLAGYARRIAPPGQEGRAIAVAMTGIPLALSLGVPAGTLIGQQIGWRMSFAAVSVLTLAVLGWITFSVPAVSRPTATADRPKPTTRQTLRVPGVPAVMVVVVTFVLGHTVIYAYIAPYLWHAGLGTAADAILLAFGIACLISIWYTGRHIDGRLRGLALTAATLFTLATAAFAATTAQAVVWVAAVVWGLGWGAAPTLLQTAAGHAGTRQSPAIADTAQAILVTLWNAAMALGGIIGGLLLQRVDVTADATAAAVLGVLSLAVIALARHHAFAPTDQDTP
ncbi:MFS transporter [Streptomyces sp. NBC_00659]|uniref:MFS transporter n=1 Tax=Streptomyces sp. NBC_00659 TaxID=2903669 RepID=UPI002E33452C|nr:MFS transporter [Streptomyces sp. NBC_00659]